MKKIILGIILGIIIGIVTCYLILILSIENSKEIVIISKEFILDKVCLSNINKKEVDNKNLNKIQGMLSIVEKSLKIDSLYCLDNKKIVLGYTLDSGNMGIVQADITKNKVTNIKFYNMFDTSLNNTFLPSYQLDVMYYRNDAIIYFTLTNKFYITKNSEED